MKLAQWIVCAAAFIATNTYSLEWEAKQFEAGIGASWAFHNTEGYGASPVISLAAGGSVPILVEQHSRLAALATISYAPIYAETSGDVGGNYSSINAQLLVEHDIPMGDRKAWAGIGLQGSFSYHFSQFKVLDSGYSELIDSSFSPSAALIGRIVIPMNSAYAISLNAQYSPMASAYSGIGAALIMHF